jgi:hypothetical protein
MNKKLLGTIVTLLFYCVVLVGSYNAGRESIRLEILEQCQNGKSVTIDGIEIHCGVISSKSIKEWNDE